MSALEEKIKSLAESQDFDTLVEILLELEARQPNYTIQMFPNPGPFPAAGPVYPFISPTPYQSPYTVPSPSFPRIGDGNPTWPNTTICHNSNSNGPEPQSDPTGYVESKVIEGLGPNATGSEFKFANPTVSDPAGIRRYGKIGHGG